MQMAGLFATVMVCKKPLPVLLYFSSRYLLNSYYVPGMLSALRQQEV